MGDQSLELRKKTRYRQAVRNWKKIAFAALLLLVVAGLVIIRPDLSASEVDARYRTEQSHFLDLPDGTRMHYLEAGPPDAPTLLLVHGSFDSAFTWERVMPALAAVRGEGTALTAHGGAGNLHEFGKLVLSGARRASGHPSRSDGGFTLELDRVPNPVSKVKPTVDTLTIEMESEVRS
jgi:hypothetical protein